MTGTTEVEQRLEVPLGELENAYNISKAMMWGTRATGLNVEQREDTVCSLLVGDEFEDLVVLAYKQYSDHKREIVRSLTTPKRHTITEVDEPVTWEVDEIAAQFCKTKGLIPKLVACLNQAEVTFTNIERLVAEYDCFQSDDYEEDGHIAIRIEVGSDQDTAFTQYDALNDWMLENLSDDKLDLFVLTVRRSE